MIIKETTQVGNSIIRKVSTKIVADSKSVQKLIRDLIDSMRDKELIGMAAPQIGSNLRAFVTEIRETKLRKHHSKKEADGLRVYINPKIVSMSKEKVGGYEGCGSVANAQIFGNVKRAKSLVVEAYNEKMEKFTLKASGLLARVIQHEIDHLDGMVFLDRLTDTKSLMSRNEYLKKFQKKK